MSNKVKLVKGLRGAVVALDAALDEIRRDKDGKFSASSGSGASTASANAANQAARVQSIIKNGPRTKGEHQIAATYYKKQANVAERKGDTAKAKALTNKARHHEREGKR